MVVVVVVVAALSMRLCGITAAFAAFSQTPMVQICNHIRLLVRMCKDGIYKKITNCSAGVNFVKSLHNKHNLFSFDIERVPLNARCSVVELQPTRNGPPSACYVDWDPVKHLF